MSHVKTVACGNCGTSTIDTISGLCISCRPAAAISSLPPSTPGQPTEQQHAKEVAAKWRRWEDQGWRDPLPPGQPEGHHVLTTNSLDGQNSANLAIKSGQPEGCELPEESESACTLTDEELTDPVFVRAYMESHMALFDGIMRDNARLRAALAARQAPAEPNQDAARLLRELMGTGTAIHTSHKLDAGQGTETDDGKVWLAAQKFIAKEKAK